MSVWGHRLTSRPNRKSNCAVDVAGDFTRIFYRNAFYSWNESAAVCQMICGMHFKFLSFINTWGIQFCIVEFSKLNLPFNSVDLYAARSLQNECISVLIFFIARHTLYFNKSFCVCVHMYVFTRRTAYLNVARPVFWDLSHDFVDANRVI